MSVVCRVAGSNNSTSPLLLRVEEADEVNESESNAASAMMLLSPRRHTMRSLLKDPIAQPDLSTEVPVDAAEQMHLSGSGALLQSVQQQDRSDDLAGLVLSVYVSSLSRPARTHLLRSIPIGWGHTSFNAEMTVRCSASELTFLQGLSRFCIISGQRWISQRQ